MGMGTKPDNYIVEYQNRNENGKFLVWLKSFESENPLEIMAHLTAMHNNRDAVNEKVRVIRVSANGPTGRTVVQF